MEDFYKQTNVACTVLPAAFSQKVDSSETTFKLHYQIVLQVRDDASLIEENWCLPFYKYLAGCVKICGGSVEMMGGTPNRVNLLIALRSTKSLAGFVCELKLLSQTWVRRKMQIAGFAWQDGIEAFTVSARERERVKALIQRQNADYRQHGGQEKNTPNLVDETHTGEKVE